MRVGTSGDFFNALSLVAEIKYVFSKCWLKKYSSISFAAVQDTDGNENYGLCKHTGFLPNQIYLPPVFQDRIFFRGNYHLIELGNKN